MNDIQGSTAVHNLEVISGLLYPTELTSVAISVLRNLTVSGSVQNLAAACGIDAFRKGKAFQRYT